MGNGASVDDGNACAPGDDGGCASQMPLGSRDLDGSAWRQRSAAAQRAAAEQGRGLSTRFDSFLVNDDLASIRAQMARNFAASKAVRASHAPTAVAPTAQPRSPAALAVRSHQLRGPTSCVRSHRAW